MAELDRPQLRAVRLEHAGPWDWSKDLREQQLWPEHARFMDELLEEGFVVLGGPLEGGREVLLVVDAPSDDAVRERFAGDPWWANGMLRLKSIELWTILLDGRAIAGARHSGAAPSTGGAVSGTAGAGPPPGGQTAPE